MAIPFVLPSDGEPEDQNQQQLEQLMLDLYSALQQVLRARNAQHPSRNHRLPRRSGDLSSTREHPMVLVDSDLSRLPLPDLVLSAVEQLPPPPPQVTVSAPSSPTRDAAFQFPECSSGTGVMTNGVFPVPSPRPKPRRRRLTSEGSIPEKDSLPLVECSAGRGVCCVHHLAASLDEREWATVGSNLRNIADDFHASKNKNDEVKSRLSFLGSCLSSATRSSSSSVGNLSRSGSTDSILSMLIPQPIRETLWTTLALYLGWRLVTRLR